MNAKSVKNADTIEKYTIETVLLVGLLVVPAVVHLVAVLLA